MQVLVECPCGQPYEFEVEPENGKMPVEVRCPTCGADGTALANACIARDIPTRPAASVAAASAMGEPLRGPMRIGPPAVIPEAVSETQGFSQHGSAPAAPVRASLVPGILGAVVAGILGMLGWYLLIKWTGYAIGYAAWGVGVLTGLGARVLARQGTKALGIVAAGCAFIAVIGGQYLVVKNQFDSLMTGRIAEAYDKRMVFARSAIQAQTDDELKAALASFSAEDGAAPNPSAITPERLVALREQELPSLRAFVDGKPSRAEFEAIVRRRLNSLEIQGRLLKDSLGMFTLLWIFLGVGSAYKIASRND